VNSACTGNYVMYNGGCVNGQKLGQFTAVNSSFTNNWVSYVPQTWRSVFTKVGLPHMHTEHRPKTESSNATWTV
jgi:hypothetical protein